MKIGITFDLRGHAPIPAGAPDDLFEEFDEPATVAAIAQVLRGLGHDPVELGNGRDMIRMLLADPPDFVFNFAEGQGIGRSRESRVPAILETLNIPYTGSDPATLGVCLDKDWARRMVQSVGVRVPEALTISFGRDVPPDPGMLAEVLTESGLQPPLIAKPACEGSSKGIRGNSLIEQREQFARVVIDLFKSYRQPVLVEEFIIGDELTVGVVGNEPPEVLGIMRVLPRQPSDRFVYSLDVKRDYKRLVDYECPARLAEADAEAVNEATLNAFDVLGCRDVARIDFRLRDGVPFFLEANPLPGLNPISGDLVLIAIAQGFSHAQLVERILRAAMDRQSSGG
jgi:D-alanine-D-alanine ligase